MTEPCKCKTLEDLKKDKDNIEKQLERMRQQINLVLGAKLYLDQEIARMEKPEEEVTPNGT